MCNNVRNGFKDEKCPKRLSKAREQVGLTWEGRCELLREALPQRKPWPAQATPPRKAPASSGSLVGHVGMPCVT